MDRNTVISIIIASVLIAGGLYFIFQQQQPSALPQETDNNQTSDVNEILEETPTPSETDNLATLRITVGDEILTATLWDNPASESLLVQLPLTLDFEDYGGRELIADPPQPITMEDMPERDSPKEGDLSFYSPSNALSLTYSDLGEWSGAVRLGRIEGDLSVLKNHSEPVTVIIEQVEVSVEPSNESEVQTPVENEESEPDEELNNEEEVIVSDITIRVNNQTFLATVEDNQTAREFTSLLPMTVTMKDHLSNEKYFDLSSGLTTHSSNPRRINTGDLMLYGSRTVVLFYSSFNTSHSYTRIGSVDDPTGLAQALGSGSVEVTFDIAE